MQGINIQAHIPESINKMARTTYWTAVLGILVSFSDTRIMKSILV